MQVAHQNDHITHAVIGGAETIDFGISTSAEFFNILSSTLYKDQILAVVREVLCNAWDAHIEAGCMHIPVEITLTEDKFTIKDFGHGIHRNDMGAIYGTYGNSTKKNDGQQTGGFGLGCKAPFAYTDHFEVISNNEGVKTIYNLSKSSAQAKGKPGIVPIASFPTKDTGLQVSIHIKNRDDYYRFFELVGRIARNGDMNMALNGKPIEKLGFDAEKANYLITREDNVMEVPSRIMVRYGNVVYPVDSVEAIRNEYVRIVTHLNSMTLARKEYNIIFQAPPHSISVTPSRESLSMQEHTLKTLKSLLTGFTEILDTKFVEVCGEFAEAAVENAVADKRIDQLLSTEEVLPLKGDKTHAARMTDLLDMAQRYMESNYPRTLEFRKKDIIFRLKSMVAAGMLPRGLVQTYIRAMDDVTRLRLHGRENNSWLQRHVLAPLTTKLTAAGMEYKRLFVFDPMDCNAPHHSYSKKPALVEVVRSRPQHLFNTLPYLRNIVVLSTTKTNIRERVDRHDTFKRMGKQSGFLFYHVGMKKNDRDQALEFFKKTGMEVVDLTLKQEWEMTPAMLRIGPTPTPRKPVKKGVPSIKSVIKTPLMINTALCQEDSAVRTENPEFMALVSLRQEVNKDTFPRWKQMSSRYLVDLFGDKGGITTNSLIYDKWIKKGAVSMEEYVLPRVAEVMMTSKNIQEYWAFDPTRVFNNLAIGYSTKDLAMTLYTQPELRNIFGIVNNLTDEEKKYVHLWNEMVERHARHGMPESMAKAYKHLKDIPIHQANRELFMKFRDNSMLDVISETGLASVLKREKPGSPKANKAVEILTLVLNK